MTVSCTAFMAASNPCDPFLSLIDAKQGYENTLVHICSRSTIRLTELKRFPFSALDICGPSLTTLAIHHHIDYVDYWAGMEDTPLYFLEGIQRLCPGLTDLTLNLR